MATAPTYTALHYINTAGYEGLRLQITVNLTFEIGLPAAKPQELPFTEQNIIYTLIHFSKANGLPFFIVVTLIFKQF